MYVDNFSGDGPYDSNLGFSLNPIKNLQQLTQKAQSVVSNFVPPALAKISPTNIIAQQAAGVAKIGSAVNALALKAAQTKAASIYSATAASPIGAKLVTPLLAAGAVYSPVGRQLMPAISAGVTANKQAQATYDAQVVAQAKAQADADAQAQREYISQQAALDAQYAADKTAADAQAERDRATWLAAQAQYSQPYQASYVPVTGGGDSYASPSDLSPLDMSTPDIENALTPPANLPAVSHWWDWWLAPITPLGGKVVAPAVTSTATTVPADNTPVPAWDPYSLSTDNTGDTMQLSNIPSRRSLASGTFKQSGLGDIWGDLMNTATTMYGQKQAASIQQSQAAQADASARIAAANAAAVAAQQRPALSTPVMLAGAAALAGALYFMRKKRRA